VQISLHEDAVSDVIAAVAYSGILFGERGVQQIQLRTEDRENVDSGGW
jgi:hypothetical protein